MQLRSLLAEKPVKEAIQEQPKQDKELIELQRMAKKIQHQKDAEYLAWILENN